jgi:hypothetical protein
MAKSVAALSAMSLQRTVSSRLLLRCALAHASDAETLKEIPVSRSARGKPFLVSSVLLAGRALRSVGHDGRREEGGVPGTRGSKSTPPTTEMQ